MGFFSSIKNFFGKSDNKKLQDSATAPENNIEKQESDSAEERPAEQPIQEISVQPEENQETGLETGGQEQNLELSTEETESVAQITESEILEETEQKTAAKPQFDNSENFAPIDDINPKKFDIPADTGEIEGQKEDSQETALPEITKKMDPFRYFAPLAEDVFEEAEVLTVKKDSLSTASESADEPDEPQKLEPVEEKDDAMLVRLRAAEPRLSVWLDIILENVENAGDLFWKRLRFLLNALEAPEQEIETFTREFKLWLERMEYWHLDEFRSELQYRLALALDLEDEEDERNRLLLKLSQGLAKTRESLGRQLDNIFASHGELDDNFWNELEELFIMADIGYETSLSLVARLKENARKNRIKERSGIKKLLLEEMETIFNPEKKIKSVNKPEVILMSGVNGAGKTTTIAKLANRMHMQGKKVLIVAADTFRAAAVEQLQVWAERAGALFYSKAQGADPASVAWEGMDMALRENVDAVFIDTAGRLQTRTNLMEELGKIRQVLGKKHPGAPHRSILVLDATTGQNALSQAKLFREAAGVDELILTKIDGTAKGGVALAVAMQENLPISFVGLGEKMEDLRPFNGGDFARALLGDSF